MICLSNISVKLSPCPWIVTWHSQQHLLFLHFLWNQYSLLPVRKEVAGLVKVPSLEKVSFLLGSGNNLIFPLTQWWQFKHHIINYLLGISELNFSVKSYHMWYGLADTEVTFVLKVSPKKTAVEKSHIVTRDPNWAAHPFANTEFLSSFLTLTPNSNSSHQLKVLTYYTSHKANSMTY